MMPLFLSSLPTPIALNTPGIENSTAANAPGAGIAYASPVTVYAPVTVTQMRCVFSGSPTGNVDMGIYDNSGTNGYPGNLLRDTGINVAATGVFTKSLSANLTLSPGIYWLAFLDTIADTVAQARTVSGVGIAPLVRTSASNLTVLPATYGANSDVTLLVALMALVQNGYS